MTRSPSTRTTESSQGTAISRLCDRMWSAIGPSFRFAPSSVCSMGSSARFPLVITSAGGDSSSSSRWSGVYGSMTPTVSCRGAISSARPLSASARRMAMGLSGEASSAAARSPTSASCRASWRSRTMIAKGFCPRPFLVRSVSTARAFRASQAR